MDLKLNRKSPIISQIKKRFILGDNHDGSNLMIFVGGGGPAGSYSAGALRALEVLNLTEVFNTAVGLSIGSVNLAYFLAGQAYILPELYNDLASLKFVNLFRFWKIYDLNYAHQSIQKNLSIQNINKSKTDFYAGATCLKNGCGKFLNVKTAGSEWDIIKASSAPPLTPNPGIKVNGDTYVDGEIGFPFPSREIIDLFKATHVLLILNRPYMQPGPNINFLGKVLVEVMLNLRAPTLKNNFSNWEEDVTNGMSYLKYELSQRIHVGILSPENSISEMCRDADVLRNSMKAGFFETKSLFE